MTILALPLPVAEESSSSSELLHTVCCDDSIALCGLDVSDYGRADSGDECAVCVELARVPHCGSATCPGRV